MVMEIKMLRALIGHPAVILRQGEKMAGNKPKPFCVIFRYILFFYHNTLNNPSDKYY